jgi:hypothetical protein
VHGCANAANKPSAALLTGALTGLQLPMQWLSPHQQHFEEAGSARRSILREVEGLKRLAILMRCEGGQEAGGQEAGAQPGLQADLPGLQARRTIHACLTALPPHAAHTHGTPLIAARSSGQLDTPQNNNTPPCNRRPQLWRRQPAVCPGPGAERGVVRGAV